MFEKVLSVEREFVGVRTVDGKREISYKRYAPAGTNSPEVFEALANIPASEDTEILRVLYNRNFLLFGKSVRNTSSQSFHPPNNHSFGAFVYRTMRNRRL